MTTDNQSRNSQSQTAMGIARVAGLHEQTIEDFEHVHEECARPARRVNHAQPLEALTQRGALCFGGDVARDGGSVEEARHERCGRQQCGKRCAHGVRDERRWGVIRTGASTFGVGHEALKGPTEHFGIDGGFRPVGRVFVCREPVAVDE